MKEKRFCLPASTEAKNRTGEQLRKRMLLSLWGEGERTLPREGRERDPLLGGEFFHYL